MKSENQSGKETEMQTEQKIEEKTVSESQSGTTETEQDKKLRTDNSRLFNREKINQYWENHRWQGWEDSEMIQCNLKLTEDDDEVLNIVSNLPKHIWGGIENTKKSNILNNLVENCIETFLYSVDKGIMVHSIEIVDALLSKKAVTKKRYTEGLDSFIASYHFAVEDGTEKGYGKDSALFAKITEFVKKHSKKQ